jgi:hypothetical protein
MNILPRDKQIAIISALTEGCSTRATERLTGIHRDTIMRLGVRVGDGCSALRDEMMQFVQVNRLELDVLWSYVGKKQKRITPTDPTDLGDQYVSSGLMRPGRQSSPTASASATATTLTSFWPIFGGRSSIASRSRPMASRRTSKLSSGHSGRIAPTPK